MSQNCGVHHIQKAASDAIEADSIVLLAAFFYELKKYLRDGPHYSKPPMTPKLLH